jgi:hypothetical protein
LSLPQAPVLDQSQTQNPYNPRTFQTTVSGCPQQLTAIGYAAFLRKLKSLRFAQTRSSFFIIIRKSIRSSNLDAGQNEL